MGCGGAPGSGIVNAADNTGLRFEKSLNKSKLPRKYTKGLSYRCRPDATGLKQICPQVSSNLPLSSGSFSCFFFNYFSSFSSKPYVMSLPSSSPSISSSTSPPSSLNHMISLFLPLSLFPSSPFARACPHIPIHFHMKITLKKITTSTIHNRTILHNHTQPQPANTRGEIVAKGQVG